MAEATKVGSIYWEATIDGKQVKLEAKNLQSSLDSLKSGFGGVATAAKGLGAAFGVALGVSALVAGFKDVISASAQMERSMLGLSQVARAFGVDTNEAEKSAKSLAKDGLMTVQESSEALKNLLATGFSLPEAIQLMNTFKDASAANRQGTLGFGEAIVGATIGIKNQNSVLVDNVGISKNLSVILREQGLSVDDLQNVTSDASVRQKLYNGLLKEGAIFSGAAADTSTTLSGALSVAETNTFNLTAAMGDALSPAVQMVLEALTGVTDATGYLRENMVGLQTNIVAITGAFMVLGQVVVGVLKGMYAAITGNAELMKDAVYGTLGGIQQTVAKTQQKIVDTVTKSFAKQTAAAKTSANQQSAAQSEKAKKMAKSLEDETYKFNEETQKRKKKFEESLADLIWAHQDKVKQIKKDLAEESKDFSNKMAERVSDFNESMDEMKKSHEEKVTDIKKDLAEENADLKEKNDEAVNDAKQRLAEEQREYAKKAEAIKVQIDKELAKGKNASQTRLRLLREDLAEETAAYQEKVDEINTSVDEETAKNTQASLKKTEDLKAQLAEEEAAYTESVAKATERDAKETARMTEENAKRVADLTNSLNQEQAVLDAHQSEVNSIKDRSREDDIARLQRQHAEENAENEKEHKRRMEDIRNKGTELGSTLGGSINTALAAQNEKIKSTAAAIGSSAGSGLGNGLGQSPRQAGERIIKDFINAASDKAKELKNMLGGALTGIPGIGAAINALASLPRLAQGGHIKGDGFALVGEKGPELVSLPAGADVIPNHMAFPDGGNLGSGGGVTQNITINIAKVSDRMDIESIGRELAYRANTV